MPTPPQNPFLADSQNAMAHGRPDQQDNVPWRGPQGPTEVLDDAAIQYAWLGPCHFGGYTSGEYADGKRVIWSNGRQTIAKLDYDTLEVLAELELDAPEGRTPQAALDVNLRGLDEKEGWEAIEHAIGLSLAFMTGLDGVYALLDRDHTFFLGRKDHAVAYVDADPTDRASAVVERGRWQFEHVAVRPDPPAPVESADVDAVHGHGSCVHRVPDEDRRDHLRRRFGFPLDVVDVGSVRVEADVADRLPSLQRMTQMDDARGHLPTALPLPPHRPQYVQCGPTRRGIDPRRLHRADALAPFSFSAAVYRVSLSSPRASPVRNTVVGVPGVSSAAHPLGPATHPLGRPVAECLATLARAVARAL